MLGLCSAVQYNSAPVYVIVMRGYIIYLAPRTGGLDQAKPNIAQVSRHFMSMLIVLRALRAEQLV